MKRFKNYLLLAVLMSMVGGEAFAFRVDGIGYGIDYELIKNNTEVAVSGVGWGTSIDIPASVTYQKKTYPVTQISSKAFMGTTIKTVTMPNSITFIGEKAFYGCEQLTSIEIPNSVTSLETGLFKNCIALTSVTIPSSVTSIGSWVFAGCKSLSSVTIPNSVKSLYIDAFLACDDMTSLRIPSSVTTIIIGDGLGSTYNSLTSIIVENGNSKYDSRIFCNAIIETASNKLLCGCSKTRILNSVTSIEEKAFYGCSPLMSIDIPNSVTSIGNQAFDGCNSLTSITIPNSVTTIGGYAFRDCSSLKSINIPDGITEIGGSTFSGCSALTNITIPNSVTSIGQWAFNGCTGLTSLTIPNSVTSIGRNAFVGCTNLTSMIVMSSTPISLTSNPFSNQANATLYVPTGSKAAYAAADYWKDFGKIVAHITFADANVRTICVANWDTDGDGELSEDEAAAVTDISGTFAGNKTIQYFNELQYFTGLKSIDDDAFGYCSNLRSLTIPNSVTTIGGQAFYECSKLSDLTIPNSVMTIGAHAFWGSAWYENQGDGLIYAGKVAYTYKGSMPANTSIVLQDGTLGIASSAFQVCSGLTSITIPNSVTNIGDGAFTYCGLRSLNIPSSLTSIGDEAFFGCSNISSITVDAGNPKYDSRDNCNAIIETATNKLIVGSNSTVIPNTVTSLGNGTFSFSKMTSITLPSSIMSIGSMVFNGESKLTLLNVEFTTPIALPEDAFLIWNGVDYTRAGIRVHVPKGCKEAFKNASSWKGFKEIFTDKDDQTLALTELPAMTYGDDSYTLPATTAEGLALTWTVTDESVAEVCEGKLIIKKHGTTTVTATQAGNDDYEAFSREFTLTIGKAALTITANDQTKVEGEENPELTVSYTGFVNGDNETLLTTLPTVTTTATEDSPVGTYPITVAGATSDDYEISYVTGMLTVTENKNPTDISLMDNAIYIEPFAARVGDDVTIEVKLKNTEAATSYGFELQLPEGISIDVDEDNAFDDAITLSTRNNKHQTVTNKLANGNYKIAVAHMSSKAITDNDGVVLTITAHVAEDMAEGQYMVRIVEPLLVLTDGNSAAISATQTIVTVEDYVKGDVNGDGKVDLVDAVLVINHYVGKPVVKFVEKAADVSGDGKADLVDAVKIINYYVGKIESLSRSKEFNELDPQ